MKIEEIFHKLDPMDQNIIDLGVMVLAGKIPADYIKKLLESTGGKDRIPELETFVKQNY